MDEFEITDEELQKLYEAAKPVVCIMVGGVAPRSPQENANSVWQALGEKYGFVWDTARPVPGKPNNFFTANKKQ